MNVINVVAKELQMSSDMLISDQHYFTLDNLEADSDKLKKLLREI